MMFNKWHIINLYIGVIVFLSGCGSSGYELHKTEFKYLSIDSLVGFDSEMENAIKPYRDSLQSEMKKVIGEAQYEIGGGLPEGLLSNFVADLMLQVRSGDYDGARPDISVVNIKGLRVPINKGSITVESIYQLMPFENEIVYLTISPAQVKELFDFMASAGGDGLAGATFGIKDNKAVDIRIGGRALEDRDYIVATSDYLADGGDHFNVFLSAGARESSGVKVRDAIIQHIKQLSADGKLVNSQLDKRIYYAE